MWVYLSSSPRWSYSDPGLLEEVRSRAGLIQGVHPDELHLAVTGAVGELEGWHLPVAHRAPARPQVHHRGAAAQGVHVDGSLSGEAG